MLLDYCEGLYPSKGTRKQDGTGHPNHGLLLSDFSVCGIHLSGNRLAPGLIRSTKSPGCVETLGWQGPMWGGRPGLMFGQVARRNEPR